MSERIILGISGASGAPIAAAVLKALRAACVEVHLIITKSAELTIRAETDMSAEQLKALADVYYEPEDLAASVSSGSYKTDGMIVVPCSMKTLAGINCGYSDNILLRAADVTLKERRKLVLAVREIPLSQIHLRNMYELSKLGAVILPPMLTYYNSPQSIEDMTNTITGKILDQFGIDMPGYKRWK